MYNAWCAWGVSINYGLTDYYGRYYYIYVRAVSAFLFDS